ncbi:hypothetical protein [Nitrospira sp. KM1]|uniref:hypothetical protein n=1 Tax=Nitrospira sp. KM1 TaxID=1936990 RepID=UPI0015660B8C|nr:hypothetical protein [Nitrospira sp. KM1]
MEPPDDSVAQALALFELTLPLTIKQLTYKRRELLHTWYPARYANLTNNPRKYMQMYKQAEEMTKNIEEAYAVLSAFLASSDKPTT